MFESLEKVEYNRQHEYMTESREKKDVAYLSQLKKEYGLNWGDVRSTWKNTHCWILTSFPKRTLFKMKCFVCIAEEGGENILKVYKVYCEEKSHSYNARRHKRIKLFITKKSKAFEVAASRAFFLFHFLLQWTRNHQVRAALFAV